MTPDSGGFPWLTVVTFVPLAGAIIAVMVPARALVVHRTWALLVTLATFGISLGLLAAYHGGAGFQLVERAGWVKSLNFNYILGVDGISLFMVLLTTFLMPAAVLVSWRIEQQVKYYMIAFLILETAMIGSFLALDLLLFFLFFEALLFPMYLPSSSSSSPWRDRRSSSSPSCSSTSGPDRTSATPHSTTRSSSISSFR